MIDEGGARDCAPEGKSALGEGLHGWITTVDRRRIAILYVIAALFFRVIGGSEAAAMRWQLTRVDSPILSPEVYDRPFTMHGTTMIFLVAMPMLLGFADRLIPLMIGARDMAFPHFNAFGFWSFLFGEMLLYFSYVGGSGSAGAGTAPDVGWFAYAPLSGSAFSRGSSTDYWIVALLIGGVGTIAAACRD